MSKGKSLQFIETIDSHTAGEPTRLVLAGGPDLGAGPLSERLENFRAHHDGFRSTVVNEPRGSDVLVGALLCEPHDPTCDIGAIFFNNVGYLGMCGHGTMGVIASLAHLGKVRPGKHKVETPVGNVGATLHPSGTITVANISCYRRRANVVLDVPGFAEVIGDIAWGGNWFFLVERQDLSLAISNVDELTAFAWAIRNTLAENGITGEGGAEIDHIELFGPPLNEHNHSRNFVLCPGKAYDRSPCGTGTSAKLACLHADGKIAPGVQWRQEGILGTVFEGTIELHDGCVVPHISGEAYVTAESRIILSENDPFRLGIVP